MSYYLVVTPTGFKPVTFPFRFRNGMRYSVAALSYYNFYRVFSDFEIEIYKLSAFLGIEIFYNDNHDWGLEIKKATQN